MTKSTLLSLSLAFLSALGVTTLLNSCSKNHHSHLSQNPEEHVYNLSNELRNLVSSDNVRNRVSYTSKENECEFTTISTNSEMSKVKYALVGSRLFKTVDSSRPEAILDDIKKFNVTFYDQSNLAFKNSTNTKMPQYAKLKLTFNSQNQASVFKTLYLR